jgi:hypothetical protein
MTSEAFSQADKFDHCGSRRVKSIEHSSTLCRGRHQSGLRRLGGAANTRGIQP